MTDEQLQDLAAAYAIGALEPGEARAFERELAARPELQHAVRDFREVAALLAEGAAGPAPRAELKEMVLARARSQGGAVVPLRPRRTAPAWLAMAAAVGGLVLAGVQTLRLDRLHRQMDALVDRRDVLERRLGVILADSVKLFEVRDTDTTGRAGAQLAWNYGQRQWLFHAFRLPRLPEGRAYQLWFVTAEGRKISAGVLDPDAEGHAILIVSVPPEARATTVAAVTTEPAGGSPQPTGAIVLAGTVTPASE